MDEKCVLRCVEPVFLKGEPVFPKMCDPGSFCHLSTGGQLKKCGTTLHHRKNSTKHGQCCVDPDELVEEQTRNGCCNHGVGTNCIDPRRRPCCLGITNSFGHAC